MSWHIQLIFVEREQVMGELFVCLLSWKRRKSNFRETVSKRFTEMLFLLILLFFLRSGIISLKLTGTSHYLILFKIIIIILNIRIGMIHQIIWFIPILLIILIVFFIIFIRPVIIFIRIVEVFSLVVVVLIVTIHCYKIYCNMILITDTIYF